MKKRKLAARLTVLALMIGLLAGCGPSGGQESQNPGGGNSSAPGGDGATWKMVMEIVNYGFNDPDLQMVQDEVNKITIPKIGVEVEFLPVPIMNMGSKLGMMVSGKEKIDLAVAGLLTSPSRLVADGLLMPITQYIEGS